jgi:thymidylate synthase (FAD)
METQNTYTNAEMDVVLLAVTRYLNGADNTEALLEHAGRVCYRSESQGAPERFLRARLREGHESIIEHASATFEIRGISRACSHQLVRHRLASYSQESQRYVAMDHPAFVVPDAIADDPQAMAVWERFAAHVTSTYQQLRDLGVPKEDARFVLPNATATRIVTTMNFRELLHFFSLRITPEAQWEIRRVAIRMLECLVPYAPTIFGDRLKALREAHPDFFATNS